MLSRCASLAVLVWHLSTRHVFAQTTEAQCLPYYSWMTNSLGQSPCLVAATLNGACTNDLILSDVPRLSDVSLSTTYPAPALNATTKCNCNQVYFNVLSACAVCQGHYSPLWREWEAVCPIDLQTVDGLFPWPIPDTTAVPAWAYSDTFDVFNVTQAQVIASAHAPDETNSGLYTYIISTSSSVPAPSVSLGAGGAAHTTITASASSTTGSLSGPISTMTNPASMTSSASTTPAPASGGSSHTGAIVGGAVGGAVGVLILATGGVFLYLRTRRQPPSSSVPQEQADRDTRPNTLVAPSPSIFVPETSQMKLYDPDDPSTFPPPISATLVGPSTHSGGSMYEQSSVTNEVPV